MTLFGRLYKLNPSPITLWLLGAHRWVPEFLDNAAKQVMFACRFHLHLPPYVALLVVSYLITK